MSSRLTFLMDEAQRRGIQDRLLVVVSAEFGRTLLNNSGGKDHNNVGGSYTIILPPGTGLGDRTVGYTGPRHEQRTINPTTGAPDPNGIVINPKHVHERSPHVSRIHVKRSRRVGRAGRGEAQAVQCHLSDGAPVASRLININATSAPLQF